MHFSAPLKIAALHSKHRFEIENTATGKTRLLGFVAKALEIIILKLGCFYEVVKPDVAAYGRLGKNDSWSGLLGMLQNGTADIAVELILLEDRARHFHFSKTYDIDQFTFLAHKPIGTKPNNPYLLPFSLYVWSGILASFFFYLGVYYIAFDRKTSIPVLALKSLGVLLQKSVHWCPITASKKILLTSWLIFSLVISFSYTNTLLSFLTLPPAIKPIKNFVELSHAVSTGTTKCFRNKASILYSLMESSGLEHFKSLSVAMDQNHWYFNNDEDLYQKATRSDLAVVDFHSILLFLQSELNDNAVDVSDDTFVHYSFCIAMRKDFCCKKQIDDVISRLWSSGLFEKFRGDEALYRSQKNNTSVPVKPSESLALNNISDSFLVLMIGYILAFGVLCIEFIQFYISNLIPA